jgi:hypothetical protein
VRHTSAGVLVLVMVCLLVLGPARPGAAAAMVSVAGIKTELKTAVFHSSELAQRGSSIAAVQLHLQHTINCIEGPQGMHFKAAAGYPCQGQGTGIIDDLRAAAAQGVPGAGAALQDVQTALSLALQAQSMQDVNQAQPWAKVVAEYLQKASDALGG